MSHRVLQDAGEAPQPLYPPRVDITSFEFTPEDGELVSLARSLEAAAAHSPYRIASHGKSAVGGSVARADAYGARGAAGAPATSVLRVLRSRVASPQYPEELVKVRPSTLARGPHKRPAPGPPGPAGRVRSGSTVSAGSMPVSGVGGGPSKLLRKQSSTASDLEELLQEEKRKRESGKDGSDESDDEGEPAERDGSEDEGEFDDYRDTYGGDGGDAMEEEDAL